MIIILKELLKRANSKTFYISNQQYNTSRTQTVINPWRSCILECVENEMVVVSSCECFTCLRVFSKSQRNVKLTRGIGVAGLVCEDGAQFVISLSLRAFGESERDLVSL